MPRYRYRGIGPGHWDGRPPPTLPYLLFHGAAGEFKPRSVKVIAHAVNAGCPDQRLSRIGQGAEVLFAFAQLGRTLPNLLLQRNAPVGRLVDEQRQRDRQHHPQRGDQQAVLSRVHCGKAGPGMGHQHIDPPEQKERRDDRMIDIGQMSEQMLFFRLLGVLWRGARQKKGRGVPLTGRGQRRRSPARSCWKEWRWKATSASVAWP